MSQVLYKRLFDSIFFVALNILSFDAIARNNFYCFVNPEYPKQILISNTVDFIFVEAPMLIQLKEKLVFQKDGDFDHSKFKIKINPNSYSPVDRFSDLNIHDKSKVEIEIDGKKSTGHAAMVQMIADDELDQMPLFAGESKRYFVTYDPRQNEMWKDLSFFVGVFEYSKETGISETPLFQRSARKRNKFLCNSGHRLK
ncbi:MAG: hypothetical protein IPK04_03415 [Bdellovibrionales bacterium]|nr:hypothetical protein [Bdellovibrionales bacterium]